MKKKVFTPSSFPKTGARHTGLYVRLFPKAGSISFSATLTKKLGLYGGKVSVLFVQDETRPADWYIELATDSSGFQPRIKTQGAGAIIQNSSLVREILNSANLELTSQRLLVGAEPVEGNMYAIITKSAPVQLKKAS